jgi:2-oxo-3-hexenedioate decarboxylase
VTGPWLDIQSDRAEQSRCLSDFSITLGRGRTAVDNGHARNVLGGPISALRYLVQVIADDPSSPSLQPGEIVTTGTLTDAHPVSGGQTWVTEIAEIPLPGLRLAFE